MNGISRNWLLKAVFLGLVFAVSVLVIKPVGVSTQFSMIGGMIHSAVDPSVITEDSSRKSGYRSTNPYYDKSEGTLAKEIKLVKNPVNGTEIEWDEGHISIKVTRI